MRHKWIKVVVISVSVLCVLVVAFVFVLPIYVQKQPNNLPYIEIEYDGKVQIITDSDEVSDVLDRMKMPEWERTFDDNSETVREIYIAANYRYLLSFIPYSNQDCFDISICF